ncbi:MAG: hypothetical protein QG673_854 [Pseudomonadota bacterium]|nr:hypothetical protein [Pseudomonadota bacterium]
MGPLQSSTGTNSRSTSPQQNRTTQSGTVSNSSYGFNEVADISKFIKNLTSNITNLVLVSIRSLRDLSINANYKTAIFETLNAAPNIVGLLNNSNREIQRAAIECALNLFNLTTNVTEDLKTPSVINQKLGAASCMLYLINCKSLDSHEKKRVTLEQMVHLQLVQANNIILKNLISETPGVVDTIIRFMSTYCSEEFKTYCTNNAKSPNIARRLCWFILVKIAKDSSELKQHIWTCLAAEESKQTLKFITGYNDPFRDLDCILNGVANLNMIQADKHKILKEQCDVFTESYMSQTITSQTNNEFRQGAAIIDHHDPKMYGLINLDGNTIYHTKLQKTYTGENVNLILYNKQFQDEELRKSTTS